jgi:hypothetical protein
MGKSHLMCGLRHALIEAGRRVLFSGCSACKPYGAKCAYLRSLPSLIGTTCRYSHRTRFGYTTQPQTDARVVIDNLRRHARGEPLVGLVDRAHGY